MNKCSAVGIVFLVASCASKTYEPTSTIYNQALTSKVDSSTQVRVHRIQQFTGSGLGKNCPLVLKVDDVRVAGLQQNQYVDIYLATGEHDLSVRFSCAFTPWRKSLSINAEGSYQEFQTELGAIGQYRMWRVK